MSSLLPLMRFHTAEFCFLLLPVIEFVVRPQCQQNYCIVLQALTRCVWPPTKASYREGAV